MHQAVRVVNILEQRGATHGAFKENASITLLLRDVFRGAPGWPDLDERVKLALDETALKLARALSGCSREGLIEACVDICGYMELARRAIEDDTCQT